MRVGGDRAAPQPIGQLAYIDAAHRTHARVEDARRDWSAWQQNSPDIPRLHSGWIPLITFVVLAEPTRWAEQRQGRTHDMNDLPLAGRQTYPA